MTMDTRDELAEELVDLQKQVRSSAPQVDRAGDLRRIDEIKAALAKRPLTEDQANKIVEMMLTTWDAIASDWLALYDNQTCPRSHVIEAVTDADRMLTHGRNPALYAVWESLSKAQQNKLAKRAFPDRSYEY